MGKATRRRSPIPWSTASQPEIAIVTCSWLPSVRGSKVNSSISPTLLFILNPDQDKTPVIESATANEIKPKLKSPKRVLKSLL